MMPWPSPPIVAAIFNDEFSVFASIALVFMMMIAGNALVFTMMIVTNSGIQGHDCQ